MSVSSLLSKETKIPIVYILLPANISHRVLWKNALMCSFSLSKLRFIHKFCTGQFLCRTQSYFSMMSFIVYYKLRCEFLFVSYASAHAYYSFLSAIPAHQNVLMKEWVQRPCSHFLVYLFLKSYCFLGFRLTMILYALSHLFTSLIFWSRRWHFGFRNFYVVSAPRDILP